MAQKIPQILFDEKRRRRFMDPEEILASLELKEGMKIADLGAGAGFFALPAAKIVGQEGEIFAVDIKKEMLEALSNRARKEDLANIFPLRANIEKYRGINIEANSCDLVLLSNVLFQSKKWSEILEEGKRILKKGKRLVIIEWKKDAPFGPEKEARVPKEKVKKLTSSLGLNFEKEIGAGTYHYGLVFKK